MPDCKTCGGRFGTKRTWRAQCPTCRAEGVPDVYHSAHQRMVRKYNRDHPGSQLPIPQPGDHDKTMKERTMVKETAGARSELSRTEHERRIITAIEIAKGKGHRMERPCGFSNGSLVSDCTECGRGVIVNPWLVTNGELGKMVGSAMTEQCVGRTGW